MRSSVAVNGVGYRARVHDGDEPSTAAVAARGDGTVRGDKHREHQQNENIFVTSGKIISAKDEIHLKPGSKKSPFRHKRAGGREVRNDRRAYYNQLQSASLQPPFSPTSKSAAQAGNQRVIPPAETQLLPFLEVCS